jgi:hypothetical protein
MNILDLEPPPLKADGHDDAVIGVEVQSAPRLVYCVEKVIAGLVRDGMDYHEAVEWFEYNIAGAYVGDQTPLWVYPVEGEL